MNVLFRAAGPDFKKGYKRATTFQNVNIYPLLTHLLGIAPSACDGKLENVADLLAN